MNRKIAETPDDLASRAVLLSMSGLDFMQAMQRGEIAGPPIARTLNFTLAEVAPGRAVFRGAPLFAHTNPMGGVHGGWYGAVLDSALGCACMTMVPQGSWYTTLEYKVNITRPIPTGIRTRPTAAPPMVTAWQSIHGAPFLAKRPPEAARVIRVST